MHTHTMRAYSRYCRYLFAAIAAGAIVFTSAVAVAEGAPRTQIGTLVGSDILADTVWTKAASPYLLTTTVHVTTGHTLTLEAGTIVSLAPQATGTIAYLDVDNGAHIAINGTFADHVKMDGIDALVVRGGDASIAYLDDSTPDATIIDWAQASIASSTFSHSTGVGLYLRNAIVDVSGSRIENNDLAGVGIQQDIPSRQSSSVHIWNSSITGNGKYEVNSPVPEGASIYNGSPGGDVHAENNWWGSAAGPAGEQFQPAISGAVAYAPWLANDPTITPCCSSVIFIPGIEASRLYSTSSDGFGNTLTMHGWEPLSNADAKSLYQNSDGSSTNQSVYSAAPIDKAYGIVGIYDSFMKFLSGLSANGTIGEWKGFGYDWRRPIAEVVAGPEKKATTTESLVGTVEAMAARSKTGKVTIIAHSNGGLVAKYLVKTLSDMGESDLIDKVISVAVPYLGTPQAIASLLHGDGQSIGAGVLLSKKTAKGLGLNMPSAYSLLPSAAYFSKAFIPTIAYASGTGTSAMSASAQDAFIGSRANAALMAAAETLHALLDPFQWPTAIARWAVVGWGKSTTKGLVYSGTTTDAHTLATTNMGDGTVVSPSAAYGAGTTTALDLNLLSRSEHADINHSNILEASSTESLLGKILSSLNFPGYSSKPLEDQLSQIPGVSLGEPTDQGYSKLVISTHSPVDLHVYDKDGNHTGIISAPQASGVTDDVVTFYETKVPGSSFDQNGGDSPDDSDTNIVLPDDSGQTYSVVVQGNGVGEFTYEVARFRGDTTVSDTLYAGLPTTPLTTASTTVTAGSATLNPLSVDVDGDGAPDIIAQAGAALDPLKFFDALKQTVTDLLSSTDKIAKDLVKRIDRIEDSYKKNGGKRLDSSLNSFVTTIGHKRYSTLSSSDKGQIITMIGAFLVQFEK